MSGMVEDLINEMKKMVIKIGTTNEDIEKEDIQKEIRMLEEEAGKSETNAAALTTKAMALKRKCEDILHESSRKENRAALVEAMDFTLCHVEEKASTKKTIELTRFVRSLKRIRRAGDRTVYLKALKALRLFVSNLVQHPDELKYRSVRVENKVFQKRLGVLDGGLECMQSIGFVQVMKSSGSQFLEIKSMSKELNVFLKRILVVLENAIKTATSLN